MDNIFVEWLGRSLKYEEVYLNAYATVAEAKAGIGAWLTFYNEERQHQEPWLSHAAANLRGRPMDMWTIGFTERLRFPRFPSKLGRRGNARLRLHTHGYNHQQKD